MSAIIDERVVSMKFDNKQFEANVKQSMSTLDKLKSKLNFKGVTGGLENVEYAVKKFKFDPLAESANVVCNKINHTFLTLQHQIDNIVDRMVLKSRNLINSLSFDQIDAGWNKYEQKTANVQTLVNSTGLAVEEINRYLDELMWYSDETSYGFTDMTQALATMTSSGGDIKKLIPMIEGVANATAFAGKGAAEFSRIMQYSINQAYSLGHMQLQDWKSIEGATVGSKQLQETLISAAEQLGKIKKGEITLSTFRETLSKGWLDKEVMEEGFAAFSKLTQAAYQAVQSGQFETASEAIEALAKDYDELAVRAFKSAQEAKSFTEAIEATKDAVSSGWMKTFELIFGNYEQAKELWTELANSMWDFFAGGAEKRNATLADALGDKWDILTSKIELAGVETSDFEKALKQAAESSGWKNLDKFESLDKAIEHYGSIGAMVQKGLISSGTVIKAIKSLSEETEESSNVAAKSIMSLADKITYYQTAVDKVWSGEYKTGSDRVKQLTEDGYDYLTVQRLVNRTADGHKLTEEDLLKVLGEVNEAELEQQGITKADIDLYKELAKQAEETGMSLEDMIADLTKPSGRELVIDSARNALIGLVKIINSVKSAWRGIFPEKDASQLYKLAEAVHNFSETLIVSDETADKLRRTFAGLFAILDLVKMVTGGALRAAFKILNAVLNKMGFSILDVTASIGDLIVRFRDWVKSNRLITGAFNLLTDAIVAVIKTIGKFIDKVRSLPVVTKIFNSVKSGIKEFVDVMGAFFKRVYELDGISLKNVKIAFADFRDNVLGHFINVDSIKKQINKLKEAFPGLYKVLSLIGNKIKDFGKALSLDGVLNIFKSFKNNLKQNVNETGSVIGGLKKTFADAFSSIVEFSKIFVNELSEKMQAARNILDGVVKFIANHFGSIVVLISTLSVFKMANAIKGISEGLDAFNKVAKGVKKVMSGLGLALKAEAIQKIAFSLTLLVGCIWILTTIDPKKALVSVGIMAAIAAILAGLLVTLSYATDVMTPKDVLSLTALLTAVSVALGILAVSMALIGFLKAETIAKGIVVIGLFSGFILALTAASILAGKNADKAGKLILKFSTSLIMLGIAFKIIGSLDNDALFKGIFVIGQLDTFILALVAISAFAGQNADKAGKMIKKISSSLLMLGIAFKLIGTLSADDIIKGEHVLDKFRNFCIILIGISQMSGEYADKAGKMIKKISIAMILLTGALFLMGKLDPSSLDQALDVFAFLTACISELIFISGAAAESDDALKLLIGLIVGMTTAIALLSLLDPKNALASAGALSMVISSLAVVAGIIGGVKISKDNLKSVEELFAALTIVISGLSLMLASLSAFDPSSLLAAATAMSEVMLVFTAASLAIAEGLSKIDEKDLSGEKIRQFDYLLGSMGVVVTGLAGLIGLMENANLAPAIDTVATMGVLLAELIGALVVLDKAKIDASAIDKQMATIAKMEFLIGLLGFIVGGLDAFNIAPSLETATAIGELMLAFSGAMVLLGEAGKIAGSTGAAAADMLLGTMAKLSALILALGVIFETVSEAGIMNIDSFVETTGKIGEAIGLFIGSIAGGLVEGVATALPGIGLALSDFMTNAQPFFDGLNSLDPGVFDKALSLVGMLAGVVGVGFAEQIGTITGIFTGGSPIDKFIWGLLDFGRGIVLFNNLFKDNEIDVAKIGQIAAIGGVLTTLAESVPSQGFADVLTGRSDFEAFSSGIVAYANAIQKVNGVVEDPAFIIDASKYKPFVDVGMALSELAGSVPPQGFADIFTGRSDFEAFSDGIQAYAQAIKKVNGVVEDPEFVIDVPKYKPFVDVGMALSELANSVPEQGFADVFTGRSDFEAFSDGVIAYAEAIDLANKEIADMDIAVDKFATITAIGAPLSSLANSVPEQGFADILTGRSDFEAFASGIEKYADAIGWANLDVANIEIDMAAFTKAKEAGQQLNELAKSVPSQSVIGLFTGETDFEAFSAGIEKYADALYDYSDSVEEIGEIDQSILDKALSVTESLVGIYKAIPNTSFWDSFSEDKTSKFALGVVYLGSGIAAFCSALEDVNILGGTLSNATKALADIASIDNLSDIDDIGSLSNLESFKTNCGKLGEGVAGFWDEVKDVAVGNIDNMISSIISMSNAAKGMDPGSFLFKSGSLDSFVTNLPAFGQALTDFSDMVKDADSSAISLGVAAAEQVSSMASNLYGVADFSKYFSENGGDMEAVDTQLTGYATALANFATESNKIDDEGIAKAIDANSAVKESLSLIPSPEDASNKMEGVIEVSKQIKQYFDNVKTLDSDTLTKNVEAVRTSISSLTDSSKNGIDVFGSIITSDRTSADVIGKQMIDDLSESIKAASNSLLEAGKEISSKYAEGVKANTAAKQAFTHLNSDMIAAIRANHDGFVKAGNYLAEGFAKGINDSAYQARVASKAMAKAAKEAAEKELDEHSPSKVFYKIGNFAAVGFANALNDGSDLAYSSSKTMAESAKEGLSNAISKIRDYLDGNIDTQPTIRPVLDLSGMDTDALNNMFTTSSIGVNANVRSISAMMASRQNGATNDDVVNAISQLNSNLAAAGGTTYNVNGVTYDDGSNVASAVQSLIRAAKIERRI